MVSTNSANPGWFGHPGSTIIYPLNVIYDLLYGDDVQHIFDENPSDFYIAGRILVIFYAICSIPVIYFIGQLVFNKTVGLIGALFFLFYPVAVYHFQVIRTDSAAVFFGLLSILLILKIQESPTIQNQILVGLFIGLGISSRYFMGLLIPILILVDLIIIKQAKSDKKRIFLSALIGFILVGLTFVITTPYFIIDFNTALESVLGEARTTHLGADGFPPIGNFRWYIMEVIPKNITWAQYILFISGSLYLLFKKTEKHLLMLSYIIFYLIGISFMSLHWSRWVIPLLPIIALISAFALNMLAKSIPASKTIQHVFLSLSVIALSAWPAYRTILLDIRSSNPSTRIEAREWILSNIKAQSRIAQEGYTAPLDDTHFFVTERYSLAQNTDINDYVSDNYDYLIVSSMMYQRFYNEPERYSSEIDFYNTLFESDCLVQEFTGSKLKAGPTIRICDLNKFP